jgi:hypothetical protein
LLALIPALLLLFGVLGPAHAAGTPDPCNSLTQKQSVVVNQSSATTTQLVALNATHGIYVCGFAITIASSATTAATATFEYSAVASCASGTTALTGPMGAGVATANLPLSVNAGNGAYTLFTVPPGSALCILTAGNAVSTTGFVTYVQGTGNTFP